MDKQKRRAGGVIDPNDIPKLPDQVAFAEKHGFPDHVEMENLLTKARLNAAIRRDIAPRYRKRDAIKHLEKLQNGLTRLIDNLNTEPHFSELALAKGGQEREEFIFELQRNLRSLIEARSGIEQGKTVLVNSMKSTGHPLHAEVEYLIELKKIHLKTGEDRSVTWSEYEGRYTGKFFRFVVDCFALDDIEMTNAALGQQIKKVPELLSKKKGRK